MKYEDAVRKLKDKKGAGVFSNRFFVRSYLADLVGGSFVDQHLVDLLFDLSALVDIVGVFKTNGLTKGREACARFYPLLKVKFTKQEFVNAVNPIAALICPEEYQKEQRAKQPKPKGTAAKPSGPKRAPVLTSPQQPPKRKKRKPIRHLEISVNARLLILRHSDQEFVLLRNKVQQPLDIASLQGSDSKLSLQLNYPGQLVELRIPSKAYKSFVVHLGDTNLISTDLQTSQNTVFKTIKIDKKGGNLLLDARASSITIQSHSGEICLSGRYQKVVVKNKKGDLKLALDERGFDSIEVIAECGGKIIGRFSHDKLRPAIRGILRKKHRTDAVYRVGNCQAHLHLETKKGVKFM